MHFVLTQIDKEGFRFPMWQLLIPQEFVPQNKSFEKIEHFLVSSLDYDFRETGLPATKVVQKEEGIYVTFVAGLYNPETLTRVFRWLKNPQ